MSSNLDPKEFEQLVLRWLDGELDEHEKLQLQEQIEHSAEKKEQFIALSRVDSSLKAELQHEALDASLKERLTLALIDEKQERQSKERIFELIEEKRTISNDTGCGHSDH